MLQKTGKYEVNCIFAKQTHIYQPDETVLLFEPIRFFSPWFNESTELYKIGDQEDR